MRLDIGRYANLRRAVEGYWRTGVLLTAVNRDRLVAAGYDDDVAIFFLVSAVASWFHMGLDGAIYVVFIGLICLSLLLGLSGVFALTRSRLERVLGLVVLIAVVAIAYRLGGDIYVIPALVPVALVPWAIYFVARGTDREFLVYAAGTGLFLGFSRFLRIDSMMPTLAFVGLLIAVGSRRRRQPRLLALGVMAIALLIPALFFSRLMHERDAYLQARVGGYHAALGHHVIWHNIYIGMGFLSNPYVPGYCDQAGIDVVEAAMPGAAYLSPAYESVLKSKVFELLKLHPRFVLFSLFSKIGVAVLMLLIAANLGLLAALRTPKPWGMEMAFWCAIILSAIPGILAVPVPKYMTGLLAFAIMYSAYSIGFARGTLGWDLSEQPKQSILLPEEQKEPRELTAA